MIKKYLTLMAALGTATIGMAEAQTQASSPSSTASMPARSVASFIQGLSAGINVGYQQNKTTGTVYNANFNSPALGVHLDYNHLISNPLFIGVGLDGNYGLTSKTVRGTSRRKELTGALTARVGVISGTVAFDVNGAVLMTGLKTRALGGGSTNQTRIGFAPGVGITFCVMKNVFASINYRYEIYPKKGAAKPRLNSHNIFAKISYNLSK